MFADGAALWWDVDGLLRLNALAGRWDLLDGLFRWLVSDYLIPVSLALALIALWFAGRDRATRYRYQIAVFVALSAMGLTSWAAQEISEVTERARPFLDRDVHLLFYRPTDFSFPSNSVGAVFAIAGAVLWVNRRLGAAMLALGAVLGLSRIVAGVHYPTDVIAGALLGIAMAALTYQLRRVVEPIPTWFVKAARILHLA